jgi:succinate dehydrogenase / fumarate reductase cytochrome b subunit
MHKPDRGLKHAATAWIPYGTGGSYRYFTGSLAYVLHRVTGLALLFFLFFHIKSITNATANFWEYDLLMVRYQEADFKAGEIALWFALLFHGINGIRLLLVDFVFDRSHVSKPLFWYFAALIIILTVLGAIPLLLHWNTQPFQPAVGGF